MSPGGAIQYSSGKTTRTLKQEKGKEIRLLRWDSYYPRKVVKYSSGAVTSSQTTQLTISFIHILAEYGCVCVCVCVWVCLKKTLINMNE